MRVYATELICSRGVLGFHTFKLALCIYNKRRSHSEILSWWAFDVTFPGSNPLRFNQSGLNVSNGGPWNPKFTLKVKSFWIKIKGQYFASQVLSRHTFKISRKKGSDFFDHRGTLNSKTVLDWRISKGTVFQIFGAQTKKALSPNGLILLVGWIRRSIKFTLFISVHDGLLNK